MTYNQQANLCGNFSYSKNIMEVININVVSCEIIKPLQGSQDQYHLTKTQPFKICLLDQITPKTYLPFIFFYPSHVAQDSSENENTRAFSTRLKTSLSEALTRFYPFSGRLKEDNLFVHEFHKGVPFKEAHVISPRMLDFLENPKLIMSSLNQFLPCQPIHNEKSNPDMPQVAIQLSHFSCGGIAIGVCISNKIADMTTCVAFLKSWAAITRVEQVAPTDELDLFGASLRFPGIESLPEFYTATNEKLWFGQGNCKSEQFVFDEEALAKLKTRASSELVSNPSRVQALSTFIWRSAMIATRTVQTSSSPRTHVILQPVNIRPRQNQRPSTNTTSACRGNLLWLASTIYNDDRAKNDEKIKLTDLVKLASKSISKVNCEYMRSIRGNEALDLVTRDVKTLEEALSNEDSVFHIFSSWVNMGLKDMDFGWGKPIWVGVFGEIDPNFRNLIVLNDATWCRGIEAWVNLDDKVLAILKNDPEFLELVSINPPIPILEN